MTPQQKLLVQQSFAAVAPIAQTAATLFYGRLFELDPTLRPLFRGDLTVQGRHLMATLAVAVRGLDNLETLVPVVQALGRRHVAFWTLEQGLGSSFTPEVRAAWAGTYDLVATTMQSAAADTVGVPAAA
jgi:hemoglobin-like flavoprotein